jgi:biofilm PGA synthesis N-glycosyltransferase PgaC
MEYLIVSIIISYLLLIIILWLGWEKSIPFLPKEGFTPKVSIVIALRNEATNIKNLLSDLEKQEYPNENLQIVLVNDHSEDDTVFIIEGFAKTSDLDIQLISLNDDYGKKAAMQKGFSRASGEIIVTTDGDCWLGPDWVRSMIAPLENESAILVSGPVALSPTKSLFERFQAIEFSSLIASGAATINLGYATMANAANMAIRRSEVIERNGTGAERSSGDDIFLLHQLATNDAKCIVFCKDPKAIVNTAPAATLSQFISQRKRWAGKWTSYKSWPTILLATYVYSVNLTLILLPVFVWFDLLTWLTATNLFIAKTFFEFFFLRQVQKFFNSRIRPNEFIILAIIYPVYVTIIGLIGTITTYYWKGRTTR